MRFTLRTEVAPTCKYHDVKRRHGLLLAGLLGLSPWAAAQLLKPLPGTSLQIQQLVKPSQDPAPVAVQVSGTPTTAVVSWTAPTQSLMQASLAPPPVTTTGLARPVKPAGVPVQASTVWVERLAPNAAPVRLALATPDATQARDPGPLTPGLAVTYRVTLTNAQGASGAKEASFTPPLPRDPFSVSATAAADGSVTVVWQEVPGVLGYQVSGVALPAPVTVNRATQWRSAPLPPGPRQWKVASVYEPGGVLTAPARWPSATSFGMPAPGMAFLSRPGGSGALGETEVHYRKQCGALALQDCRAENVLLNSIGWQRGLWGDNQCRPSPPGAAVCERRYTPQAELPEVAFADLHDLGRGRRVGCAPGVYGIHVATVCWATTHGAAPASGEPANGVALAQAAQRNVDRNVSLSTIVITPRGALFGQWVPPPPPWPANDVSTGPSAPTPTGLGWWDASGANAQPEWLRAGVWDQANLTPLQREAIVAAVARPSFAFQFDGQGQKPVPHACLSCHGGRYDASTGMVQGASLLPLIPANLTFASAQEAAAAEEPIRRLNQIILRSDPAPAIQEQLAALYGGAVGLPGARSNAVAVPPGWSQQAGLYRQVIAPYCGSCHFAQRGALNFATFAHLLQNKQAIQNSVCARFTMPHSQAGFTKFWTSGGAVSLPGLLSTVLGFSNCPQ